MNNIDLLRAHHPWPAALEAMPFLGPVWFGDGHLEVFRRYINDQTKVVLELGSFLGRSTLGILSIATNATVIAVDTWQGSVEHHVPEFEGLLPNLYETFLANTWDHRDRLIPIRENTINGMSEVAAQLIQPEMVYVDASHTFEDVVRDISTVLDYFPGAQIVGDDIGWESVRLALSCIVEQRKVRLSSVGNVWWITR